VSKRSVQTERCTRPCLGETVSGDAAVVVERDGKIFLAIIDVLGHGPEAHDLALEIERFLHERWSTSVTETLRHLHEELKGSRGAAVGLGVLDVASGELRYVGVGNTIIRKFGARPTTLPSRDGIVGSHIRTPLEHNLHLADGDVLVLYTDGVRSHFDVDEYPRLISDDAHTVATSVVQRFGKDHDDASCIALRYVP
jgi:serine phosphatase RsbU (regulator of sigma subunit)